MYTGAEEKGVSGRKVTRERGRESRCDVGEIGKRVKKEGEEKDREERRMNRAVGEEEMVVGVVEIGPWWISDRSTM